MISTSMLFLLFSAGMFTVSIVFALYDGRGKYLPSWVVLLLLSWPAVCAAELLIRVLHW